MTRRPERGEAGDYWFTYIDQVGAGTIGDILSTQATAAVALLETISEEASLKRPTPEKWSIREVVGHVNDAERLFVFRAMWFARGFDSALPSFDQNIAVSASGAEQRPWASHIDEFRAVRAATSAFFRHLPDDSWVRRGVASGSAFTVRALAYITAGHVEHHLKGLRANYSSH
jgi:hypothetical protein